MTSISLRFRLYEAVIRNPSGTHLLPMDAIRAAPPYRGICHFHGIRMVVLISTIQCHFPRLQNTIQSPLCLVRLTTMGISLTIVADKNPLPLSASIAVAQLWRSRRKPRQSTPSVVKVFYQRGVFDILPHTSLSWWSFDHLPTFIYSISLFLRYQINVSLHYFLPPSNTGGEFILTPLASTSQQFPNIS